MNRLQTLYLLRCKHFIKVGICSDLDKRIASLQTGNPYRIEVVTSYPYLLNARSVERAIHSRLIVHRGIGEWFRNDKDVEAVIDTLVQEFGRFADVPQRRQAERLTLYV